MALVGEVSCRVEASRVGSVEQEGECVGEGAGAGASEGILRREREGYVRWRSVSVRMTLQSP